MYSGEKHFYNDQNSDLDREGLTTYYVRDVQGNTIAVYEMRKSEKEPPLPEDGLTPQSQDENGNTKITRLRLFISTVAADSAR